MSTLCNYFIHYFFETLSLHRCVLFLLLSYEYIHTIELVTDGIQNTHMCT